MMLEVRDLHAFYGKSHILQGVDLRVDEGEIVSLLGRNGVGRSTTCKAIMGLVAPVGQVGFKGRVDRRPAARPDRPSRHRLRAGGPPGLPDTDRAAEPRTRAEARRSRRALEVRGRVRAVSQPRRAPGQSGRRAVGRRAADAHDVPHPDGRSGSGHHRRADRGPGAEAGRAGRHAAGRNRQARHRDPAGGAEAHHRADGSRAAST